MICALIYTTELYFEILIKSNSKCTLFMLHLKIQIGLSMFFFSWWYDGRLIQTRKILCSWIYQSVIYFLYFAIDYFTFDKLFSIKFWYFITDLKTIGAMPQKIITVHEVYKVMAWILLRSFKETTLQLYISLNWIFSNRYQITMLEFV